MLKTLKLPLVAAALLAGSVVAHAADDPSAHQIYEAMQSGHMAQAQQMIGQVLKDHPDSARAHYIAAELDARSGDPGAARQQLAQARAIDPKLAFADAHSVGELEAQLGGRSLAQVQVPAPQRHASVPWGLILLLAAGGLILWNLFRRRQAASYPPPASYGYGAGGAVPPTGPGPGYGPGYGYGAPYPPAAGGMGSGIVGGLATGLAVGAGVAAGEALVDHMIHPGQSGYVPQPQADLRDTQLNQDAGGQDFGTSGGDSWGDSSAGGGDFFGGGDSGGGGDWT